MFEELSEVYFLKLSWTRHLRILGEAPKEESNG